MKLRLIVEDANDAFISLAGSLRRAIMNKIVKTLEPYEYVIVDSEKPNYLPQEAGNLNPYELQGFVNMLTLPKIGEGWRWGTVLFPIYIFYTNEPHVVTFFTKEIQEDIREMKRTLKQHRENLYKDNDAVDTAAPFSEKIPETISIYGRKGKASKIPNPYYFEGAVDKYAGPIKFSYFKSDGGVKNILARINRVLEKNGLKFDVMYCCYLPIPGTTRLVLNIVALAANKAILFKKLQSGIASGAASLYIAGTFVKPHDFVNETDAEQEDRLKAILPQI